MTAIAAYGITPATALVVMVAVALGAFVLFLGSLRRFEIALLLVLVSSWSQLILTTGSEKSNADSDVNVGTYVRIAMIALAGAMGCAKFIQRRPAMQRPIPACFPLLGAFLLYALASATYSIAAQSTLIRATEALLFFGFLLGFYSWLEEGPVLDKALNVFCAVMAVFILLNLAAIPLFPARAWWVDSPGRFVGLTGHPNAVGMLCLLSYPLFLWRHSRSSPRVKPMYLCLLGCTLFAHVLSGSRSSLFAAAIGLFVWCVTLRQWLKVTVLVGAALAGTAALGVLPQLVPSFQRHDSDDVTDLTGRDELWRNVYQPILKKPWTGYGYEVSGEVLSSQQFQGDKNLREWGSANRSLHNGYLSVAIGSGLIGLLWWLIILFLAPGRLLFALTSDYKALVLASIAQMLILNFFESAITSSRTMPSQGFWLFWVMASTTALFAAKPPAAGPDQRNPIGYRPAAQCARRSPFG